MAKFTKDDIKLLAKQMRGSHKDEKPFTLLTGAGCSVSAGIPLAGTLIKEILKTYGDECRKLDDEQLRDYGACMSCVPTNARRKLFTEHIKNAKINWAHISIACLMQAGYVGRVITFNFDSILARACGLLGMYPPTYDFAAAATVDTDYISPQAIIHLHGQGTGKYLLNSDKETHDHAESIRPLISATFADSSVLVIGYSGSSDAAFRVIAEEYTGRENLWWAGYETTPNENVDAFINPYNRVAYYLGECDADEFLIELAEELGCFPPTLISDPYGHLLNELTPVADFPLKKNGSSDLLTTLKNGSSDLLTTLKNELTEAQKLFNSKQNIPELMMKGEWDKVIQLSDTKNPEHKEHLAWAYIKLGDELSEKARLSNDEPLFQESFDKYQQALVINPNNDIAFNNWGTALAHLAKTKNNEFLFMQACEKYQKTVSINPNMHEAFNNWGNVLADLAAINFNDVLFQQSFEKYHLATTIKPDYYVAFNNWALTLFDLAKQNGNEILFKKSCEKCQKAIAIKPDYYEAFYNWGATLFDLAKRKDDETLFKQSIEKYQQAITIKSDYYEALNNWGIALSELAKIKRDEALFQQSAKKYQQATTINPAYYNAFNNWGIVLSDFARFKDDEAIFQQSAEKYHQATTIKPDYYEAFYNWGSALFELAKRKNDETLFQQSIEKYQQATAIKPDYYEAFYKWGSALSELAKLKNDEILFQKSSEKFKQAIAIKPDFSRALYNWGSALLYAFELTKKKQYLDQAKDVLISAEKLDPDQVYNLACLYSRLNEKEKAKEKLYHCRAVKTLPGKAHLSNDKDMDNVRGESWFEELINLTE